MNCLLNFKIDSSNLFEPIQVIEGYKNVEIYKLDDPDYEEAYITLIYKKKINVRQKCLI